MISSHIEIHVLVTDLKIHRLNVSSNRNRTLHDKSSITKKRFAGRSYAKSITAQNVHIIRHFTTYKPQAATTVSRSPSTHLCLSSPTSSSQQFSPLLSLEAQLLHLDPRQNPRQRNNTRNNNSPKLHLEHILIKRRLRRRTNRRKHKHQNNIPTHTVVLVDALRIIHTAIQSRQEILREADQRLHNDQDVRDETQDRVRRLEMHALVRELVDLDDDETGDRGGKRDPVEARVYQCALLLLLGCVCWLQHEHALDVEEDGG